MKSFRNIILGLIIIIPTILFSQNINQLDKDLSMVTLSPEEFDLWIEQEYEELILGKKKDCFKIENIIKERLSKGLFTSDDAFFTAIKFFLAQDNKFKTTNNSFGYKRTIEFIDKILLKNIYKRDLLKALLLEKKAFLYMNRSFVDKQLDSIGILSYNQAVEILTKYQSKINKSLYKSYYELGSFFLSKHQEKQVAESYFVSILKFPFYNLKNAKDFSFHRELYIKAGLRRIECNRGNLEKLKQLYFIPSTTNRLHPPLKNAIEDMGGMWDRDNQYEFKFGN